MSLFVFDSIEDYISKLKTYFPLDKVNDQAGTSDVYLMNLFKIIRDNYINGNYQVLYFHAHLVFMSYVYYKIEKLLIFESGRVEDIFYSMRAYSEKNKPNLGNYSNVYEFSYIPEKEILKLFKAAGLKSDTIKRISKYISMRDDYAHATNKGNFDDDELNVKLKEIFINIDEIENCILSYIKTEYIKVIKENIQEDEYKNVVISIEKLIDEFSLSKNELSILCELGISNYRNTDENIKTNFRVFKRNHNVFIGYCLALQYYDNDEKNIEDRYTEEFLYFEYKDSGEEYIENILRVNKYRTIKNGGEFPLSTCPECSGEQLVYEEEKQKYHCFDCGSEYGQYEIGDCERCGEKCLVEDDSVPLCDICIENVFNNKD